ncbi:proline iminopeptidase-family hydrolase [Mesobacillus jeotgali]|uniref:proline iminopeptidase-family hydrolase n=1 Tax=Mesobacillus jeotgali TaxID=129985 RepID=UPI00177D2916|nr:proline iminopeptidase-family hydrolase [Mesobacillus jeotgali]UYZ24104.1 proline iminopeptidase-family hydrolase [Mesobacillus jeotgali]
MYEEGFVNVTGGRVWYEIYNKDAEGTPVVILHGGPGSSTYSLKGLKKLGKDRPVVMYDQLGCGKSDRPDDLSLWKIDRFVDELGQVREALELDEVHILGHSWGTTLAAAYVLTKPTGVKSVIFSGPCLSAPMWEEDQKRNIAKLPADVQETILRCEESGETDSEEFKAAIKEFNKEFVFRGEPDLEWLKAGAGMKNPVVYETMWGPSEFTVKGNLKTFDCTPQLGEIECSTLYTCGHFDEATPESTGYYAKLTPGAEFHVFEKSAHMPYMEEPEEYLQVMGDFLKKVDRQV